MGEGSQTRECLSDSGSYIQCSNKQRYEGIPNTSVRVYFGVVPIILRQATTERDPEYPNIVQQ